MSHFTTLKKHFCKVKAKLKHLIPFNSIGRNKPVPTSQPSDSNATEPSINNTSGILPPRPSPSSNLLGVSYWRPHFQPSTPIQTFFQQEIGAHGWGNHESQNYTNSPANCFFTPSNTLILRAISNPDLQSDQYTSARLITHQKLNRPSGFLTARLTVPQAPGIWPAFWLLPTEPYSWPTDGEIDICETWNGDAVNHACLHWGNYSASDSNKHRVIETPLDSLNIAHDYGFAWDQTAVSGAERGRLIWYLDETAIMRASIPEGIRPLQDFRVLLNVAMGGDVCQGTLPTAGTYDLIVHELCMLEEPCGGWQKFDQDWNNAKEGNTM